MITNICIKNSCQTTGIFHGIVVKYVVYKRRWLSHSGWFINNREEAMGKHGICKILARSMFIYIQEVDIVIPQHIWNFIICFNLGQALHNIVI